MRLFDTHCHLQDPAFRDLDAVLERAREVGVERMLLCGYDLPSSETAIALSEGRPALLPAVGIHPHDARDARPGALDRIEELARDPRVAAVGEIGLDYYRDLSPRDQQMASLESHLAIAAATGKPVSIHSRGAEDDIYTPLQRYAEVSPLRRQGVPVGVMHCFGGSATQAARFVEIGFLVSVPCTVTYPNNHEGRRIAAELPLESLVVETDSPYLPPQGRRGKRNEPAFVGAAVEAIAELRGVSMDAVAEATLANAKRVFERAEVAVAP